MKKSPVPILRPLERYDPDNQNYKAPELKTPQSLVDRSISMTSNSQVTY